MLPDFAEGVTADGVPRQAYGVAIDNESSDEVVDDLADLKLSSWEDVARGGW